MIPFIILKHYFSVLLCKLLVKVCELMNKHDRIKDIVFLAMISALALVSALIIKFPLMPSAPFLKFDVKDAVIFVAGFMYGPLAALGVSALAALLQFLLANDSGIIGFFMNLLSTASFVCTASFIYRLGRNRKALILGLIFGALAMTAIMILWNYIITPIFMGIPRAAIVPMLFTIFLPFNLLKGGINAIIILLYIKPLSSALSGFGDNKTLP